MGIAAAEFFSANNTEKQTLVRRISPTEKQMDQQRQRWDALSDFLLSDLARRSDYSMRHWLQGSYKLGTQVRPPKKGLEFDIDLGIYFVWEGSSDSGNYSPLELKTMVQDSLCQYAERNKSDVICVTPPKERCCRIKFYGDFHIDVPTYHLDDADDFRELAVLRDAWEQSDPKPFHKWFLEEFDDATRARLRRHIKYIKAWASLKFSVGSGPPSVLLTVLVADAVAEMADSDMLADDDAFCDIVQRVYARLEKRRFVANPADPVEDLAGRLSRQQFEEFLEALKNLKSICAKAVAALDGVEAADIWSEAFEHFFPAADDAEIDRLQKSTSHLARIQFVPEVTVVATSKGNRNLRFTGQNRIGPIPKDCDIQFTLSNSFNLPPASTVHWTVRNEGEEAEEENDLGHGSGEGLQKAETSAYVGTHHMDCTVRRGGKIIGYRRIPVVIQGVPVAARNPPRPNRPWQRS